MENRILIVLTNGFDPDLRTFKEAKYLVQKGFYVEILCWDRENRYLDKKTEVLEGICIRRFFPYTKYGTGFRQIIPYMKFIKECRRYMRNINERCFCHCADLTGMIAGIVACRHDKTKLIFDMWEFYESGSLVKFRYLVRFLVRFLQNQSYKVIYLNDLQKKYVQEKNEGKLVYLPNYPEAAKFYHIEKSPSNKIRVSFIGYVRHEKQLKALIDAAGQFPEDIEVSIHGRGVLQECLSKYVKKYSNCFVTGDFNHDHVDLLYRDTDLLYCVYDVKDDNDRNAYPTKFFEAIITKTPMIVARNTVISRFCKDNNIGYSIGDNYIEDLVEVFSAVIRNRSILEKMSENEMKIQKNYLWEQVVSNLDMIYK